MNGATESNLIIVFTGPDGSGRKSVAEAVGHTFLMTKVLSFVTRPSRPGEVDGQDYHFVSHAVYSEMEASGQFLESVEIDGHRYGIRGIDIERSLEADGCAYLIMNSEGADILKKKYGDKVVRLFIYADRRTVEQRQLALGLDEALVRARLDRYDADMSYRTACEHAFENYDLGQTAYAITNTLEHILQRDLVDKD